MFIPLFDRGTFSATHRYKLAPESILPPDIRKAPEEVREMERSTLSAADQKKFYQTNAEKVFGL